MQSGHEKISCFSGAESWELFCSFFILMSSFNELKFQSPIISRWNVLLDSGNLLIDGACAGNLIEKS